MLQNLCFAGQVGLSGAKRDNPVGLSARRIHQDYCIREVALEIRLRKLRQAYIVASDPICIASCEQDGNVRPFAFNCLGEFRSGHFRHGLIGNDEVNGILAPENFERFFPGILKDGVAQVFEHGDRIHQDHGVIVHCQNRKRTKCFR
jgi:hypothetical protein